METREELEKILTLEEVKRLFATKEGAMGFFDVVIKNLENDLKKLDDIERLFNMRLYPLGINNTIVSKTLEDFETKLRKELRENLMALIAEAKTKKDIISKL